MGCHGFDDVGHCQNPCLKQDLITLETLWISRTIDPFWRYVSARRNVFAPNKSMHNHNVNNNGGDKRYGIPDSRDGRVSSTLPKNGQGWRLASFARVLLRCRMHQIHDWASVVGRRKPAHCGELQPALAAAWLWPLRHRRKRNRIRIGDRRPLVSERVAGARDQMGVGSKALGKGICRGSSPCDPSDGGPPYARTSLDQSYSL
jgi:hypothetical protein